MRTPEAAPWTRSCPAEKVPSPVLAVPPAFHTLGSQCWGSISTFFLLLCEIPGQKYHTGWWLCTLAVSLLGLKGIRSSALKKFESDERNTLSFHTQSIRGCHSSIPHKIHPFALVFLRGDARSHFLGYRGSPGAISPSSASLPQ